MKKSIVYSLILAITCSLFLSACSGSKQSYSSRSFDHKRYGQAHSYVKHRGSYE